MTTADQDHARINIRVDRAIKATIKDAAAVLGQSVSDCATSTMASASHSVLQEAAVTRLSDRDRDLFIALLDDRDAEPNDVLKREARWYASRVALDG